MKHVLFVHQSAELYGSDRMLLELLKGLDRASFTPVVVLPGEGPLKEVLLQEDIEVVITPVLKLYRKMFTPTNLIAFVKSRKESLQVLAVLHERYNFSVVYSNTLAVLLGAAFSSKYKIKHLWHVHEIIVHPKPIAFIFPRILKHYADIVICNSEATKVNLVKRVDILAKKIKVVYNGLENRHMPNVSVKEPLRQTLGFSDTDIVVTLVGRISRLKGHRWLLDAYTTYLGDKGIKLLFVGSPVPGQESHLHDVEQIILANNLQKSIKILPFTQGLQQVWESTDVAVMPSTEAESFGLVALEAMLNKKPVVAANLGGLKEIVVQNKTGFLVTPEDNEALAKALLELAENASMRQTFAQNGYERATTVFTLDNYVKGITEILKS